MIARFVPVVFTVVLVFPLVPGMMIVFVLAEVDVVSGAVTVTVLYDVDVVFGEVVVPVLVL